MDIGLDFDGTLVTCQARHVALMRTSARRLGVPLDSEAYWSHKRQGLSNVQALGAAGLGRHAIDALCAMWSREIERFPWLGFDQPIEGVENALAALVSRGHRLHLLTARANASHLFMQIERLRLQRFMTSVTVVSQGTVVEEKAAALSSQRCAIYIGDTESDHDAATRASVPFGAVASGMRSESFLQSSGMPSVRATLLDHLDRFIHV